jgi:hypothetical protein
MNKKELNLMKFEKDKRMKHGRLQKRRKDKIIRKGSSDQRKNIGNGSHGFCPRCDPQLSIKIIKRNDLEETIQKAKVECDLYEVQIE